MRVIAGRFKYTPLISPKNNDIRPTTDRVKEDIFNILMPFYRNDGLFLDLFCGTGSIGIEAVSRGFAMAELVDSSRTALELATKNVAKTRHKELFRLVRSEASSYLIATANRYDIIFMDAPYDYADTDRLCDIIVKRDLLKDTGILVVERSSHEREPQCALELYRVKKYSATTVYYYVKPREEDAEE